MTHIVAHNTMSIGVYINTREIWKGNAPYKNLADNTAKELENDKKRCSFLWQNTYGKLLRRWPSSLGFIYSLFPCILATVNH